MSLLTRGALVVGLLALAAAAPASAASWTASRTAVSARVVNPWSIAMNSRGDAMLVGELNYDEPLFTAVRPAGGRFGAPRRFRRLRYEYRVTPLLDRDRGGALIGTYLDPAPEVELDLRDACCYRVIEALVSRRGGVRSGRKLTRHAERTYEIRVETDDSGAAGAAWLSEDGWAFSTRSPGGRFSAPRRLALNPGYGSLAVRPSGWAFAEWIDYDRGLVFAGHQPRSGPVKRHTIYRAPSNRRVLQLGQLVIGRNGHVWATWGASPTYADKDNRVMAAPRRSDGTYGRPVIVSRGTSIFLTAMAVDDRGDLHAGWRIFPRGGWVRTVSRTRGARPAVRIPGSPGGFVLDGGPGGRAVVGWQRGSRVFAAEQLPSGRVRHVRQLDSDDAGAPIVAMSRRGEALAVWTRTVSRRTHIRYAALRP
jgi:hypothetical protein